jgi:hypothetical protein
LNPEPNESKVKRSCEEMRIHSFTAPFYFSSSFLRLRGKIKRKFRNEETP